METIARLGYIGCGSHISIGKATLQVLSFMRKDGRDDLEYVITYRGGSVSLRGRALRFQAVATAFALGGGVS